MKRATQTLSRDLLRHNSGTRRYQIAADLNIHPQDLDEVTLPASLGAGRKNSQSATEAENPATL